MLMLIVLERRLAVLRSRDDDGKVDGDLHKALVPSILQEGSGLLGESWTVEAD